MVKRVVALLLLFACQKAPEPPGPALTPTPDPSAPYEVFVPADLEDALDELEKLLPRSVHRDIVEGSEGDIWRYHHGLGTWLRNNWGLWGGSRLARHFNDIGLSHPDDMSGVILKSYWRRANGVPLEADEQVARHRAYWESHQPPPDLACPSGEVVSPTSHRSLEHTPGAWLVLWDASCPDGSQWQYESSKGWYSAP